MRLPVMRLFPAVFLPVLCEAQAPQSITLTAVTPKIISFTNLNDGVTLSPQVTGPGSFKFTITSFAGTQGSGSVTISPPATLTAVDAGTILDFSGFAQFSGQATWTTNDSFIETYWTSGAGQPSTTDNCESDPLKTGAFTCQIQGPISVESVGGQRLAYFDGFIFYYDKYVDEGYTINVRMYYQIAGGSTAQSAVEAVQVTQSFATDTPSYAPTPLIAGKTTTIRLYPIQDNPPGPVGGQIKVISDHLLGTLTAPYDLTPQSSINRDYVLPRRSFDFEIPAAWTTKGDLTVGGLFLDRGFGAPENPDALTLHFQNQAKPFSVRYMEWCAPISNPPPGTASATPVCTSSVPNHSEDMADAIWFTRATYPTADDGIIYHPMLGPAQTWKGDMRSFAGTKAFVNHLRRWYIVMKTYGLDDDQFIAWFPDDRTWAAAGEADPIGYNLYPSTTPLSAVGHVAWVSDTIVYRTPVVSGAEESLAHEIGHNLGLRHPTTAHDWGGTANDPKACFPYGSTHIQNPGYFSDSYNPMLVPTTAWDFMSYHAYQPNWLTPYTYDILVRGGLQPQDDSINRDWDPTQDKCVTPATPHAITEGFPPLPTDRVKPAAAAPSTDSIVISGTVSQNGSVTLVPSYRVASGIVTDQSDPAGTHCINFNNGPTNLSSFCFQPSFDDPEGGPNSLTTDSFTFVMPFPTQTSSIALSSQGIQVASVAVSSNAPAVSFTSPKTGDTWNGGSQTISWTASDADGDTLSYTLLYSTDGGNSYQPLALDITGPQFPIDPSSIMGGSVYFRVLASDGVNTSTATAGPITVNQTPKLTAAAGSFAIGNGTSSSGTQGVVTLVSSGSGPVTITSASIDNPAFAIVHPPMPLIIPAGRRASLTVTFLAPAGVQGTQTGTITVASNDPLGPLNIPIGANAFTTAVANAIVTPKSLSFAAAPGQTQDLTISVLNTGSANLTINSVSISNASFMAAGVQTPLTVTPGAAQAVTIRFTAPSSGAPIGTVTMNTNDPSNPSIAVAVSGVILPGSSANAPQITGVVNGASFQTPLAPGELAALFGTNLAASPAQPSASPLPTKLNGVQVTVAGIAAPLLYISPNQINFQVPFEVQAGASAAVVVTVNGTASPAVSAPVASYGVGVFTYARTASAIDPIVTHALTNQLVTPSSPASPNEALVVYATGVGNLLNAPPTGFPAPSSPLAEAVDTPQVTVGGATTRVLFAGLAPGFVGLAQINIQLPPSLPAGSSLPLVIAFPGNSSPPVNLAVAGSGGGSAPKLSLSTTSLSYGSVTLGQTKDLSLTLSNIGTAPLTANLAVTGAGYILTTPALFTLAAGASQTVTVGYAPTNATASSGSLTINSNDPSQPSVSVSLSGSGVAPASVILSDSFHRANATACALAQADLALGGSGTHYYLPIFPGSNGPIGASIVSGALENNGLDFGGVQLTALPGACSNLAVRGETLPQDLNISVDLLVPKTGGNVTVGGPYFRSRAAAAGDGIVGGSSAGYWVQLVSTGEIRVGALNPFGTVATAGPVASFDSTVKHTLQIAVQGSTFQASLDGQLLTFSGSTSVILPASGGSNDGAVGIAFGSPDNRGQAGGQLANNLVVSAYSGLH